MKWKHRDPNLYSITPIFFPTYGQRSVDISSFALKYCLSLERHAWNGLEKIFDDGVKDLECQTHFMQTPDIKGSPVVTLSWASWESEKEASWGKKGFYLLIYSSIEKWLCHCRNLISCFNCFLLSSLLLPSPSPTHTNFWSHTSNAPTEFSPNFNYACSSFEAISMHY